MAEKLETTLPITVYARPNGTADWREIDQGPGVVDLPEGEEIGVRVHTIDDESFETLAKELSGVAALTMLNLSENRRISDEGLESLRLLPQLRILNLSSVSMTSTGMDELLPLIHLTHLDLSFCNRINDLGVKKLRGLPNLEYLRLQGCAKVTNAGAARIMRRGLEIYIK